MENLTFKVSQSAFIAVRDDFYSEISPRIWRKIKDNIEDSALITWLPAPLIIAELLERE